MIKKEIKEMNKKVVIKSALKKGVIGIFLAGGLICGAGLGLATDLPETIDINTQKACADIPGLKKDIKEVKGFTHKAHINYLKGDKKDKFVCATCHKGAKTEKDIIDRDKCKRLAEELKEAGGVKKYFHNTCLKCHKTMKKEGLKTGPVSCKSCHNRKEGGKK